MNIRDISNRFLLSVLIYLFNILPALAQNSEHIARTILRRVSGGATSQVTINSMIPLVQAGNYKGAAEIALASPEGAGLYNAVLPQVFTPIFDADLNPSAPLNDGVATLIGTVRDDLDWRTVLSGTQLYAGDINVLAGINAYANNNNNHYSGNNNSLESRIFRGTASFANPAQFINIGQAGNTVSNAFISGVLTTRAWSAVNYSAGTLRRPVYNLFLHFFGTALEDMKDTTLPTDRIRRDVSLAPGGDPDIFLNDCSGCHRGMDPIAGAFVNFDHVNGQIRDNNTNYCGNQNPPGPPCNNINPDVERVNRNFSETPSGYITIDETWENRWATAGSANQNRFNFEGASSGDGLNELGVSLANSEGFRKSAAKLAFKAMCLRESNISDNSTINSLALHFLNTNHDFKDLLLEVVALPECNGSLHY